MSRRGWFFWRRRRRSRSTRGAKERFWKEVFAEVMIHSSPTTVLSTPEIVAVIEHHFRRACPSSFHLRPLLYCCYPATTPPNWQPWSSSQFRIESENIIPGIFCSNWQLHRHVYLLFPQPRFERLPWSDCHRRLEKHWEEIESNRDTFQAISRGNSHIIPDSFNQWFHIRSPFVIHSFCSMPAPRDN